MPTKISLAPDHAADEIEMDLLLEGIHRRYGYDFKEYAPGFIQGVVRRCLEEERLSSVPLLLERILREPRCLERFLVAMGTGARAQPFPAGFYRAFRAKVIPFLRTYPSVQVWWMGCGTGQDLYSLAILLEEELSQRHRIYATDLHETLLVPAASGVYGAADRQAYQRNYEAAGGKRGLDSFLKSSNGKVVLSPALRKNIVFASYCPVTDGIFNEFHVILCKDGLETFGAPLRERVLRLFDGSLRRFGVLVAGKGADPKAPPLRDAYRPLDARHRIYRKVGL